MAFGDMTFGAVGYGASAYLAPPPTVWEVRITPSGISLHGGDFQRFFAEVLGENFPSQEVDWVTTLGFVDPGGTLTAPLSTYQLQQGTLTAISREDPEISASINFSVLPLTSDFVPSTARTVRILPGQNAFAVGSHWKLGTAGPIGPKDPNSTIDIPFDWSAWLADIGNAKLSKIEFFLGLDLQSEGVALTDTGGTILVSGGQLNTSTTVTCRITTATAPARVDDRTVVLQIKEQ